MRKNMEAQRRRDVSIALITKENMVRSMVGNFAGEDVPMLKLTIS